MDQSSFTKYCQPISMRMACVGARKMYWPTTTGAGKHIPSIVFRALSVESRRRALRSLSRVEARTGVDFREVAGTSFPARQVMALSKAYPRILTAVRSTPVFFIEESPFFAVVVYSNDPEAKNTCSLVLFPRPGETHANSLHRFFSLHHSFSPVFLSSVLTVGPAYREDNPVSTHHTHWPGPAQRAYTHVPASCTLLAISVQSMRAQSIAEDGTVVAPSKALPPSLWDSGGHGLLGGQACFPQASRRRSAEAGVRRESWIGSWCRIGGEYAGESIGRSGEWSPQSSTGAGSADWRLEVEAEEPERHPEANALL
ncbi:hypothetical protein EVG20_g11521, partial [Dentipellis fragilis]